MMRSITRGIKKISLNLLRNISSEEYCNNSADVYFNKQLSLTSESLVSIYLKSSVKNKNNFNTKGFM